MGRKKFVRKREILPDPKFNDVVVAKFINSLMTRGQAFDCRSNSL